MTERQRRAVRGSAAAATAAIIAATAHTLAGGGAPSALVVVAVALLASPVAVVLSGRRTSLWATTFTVLLSQSAFHTVFGVAGGYDPTTGGHTGAHAHGATSLPMSTSMDASTAMAPDAPMVLAHLAAAVLTIALLHRGEHLLIALGRGILRLVRRVTAVPATSLPRTLSPVVVATASVRTIVVSDLSRRGPPVVVAAR